MNWPLIAEGAMGTMLFQAGLRPGECGELWNLERPATVEAIHRAYVDAGAQFLTTNTFGATPIALARHGLSNWTADVNRDAVAIARDAAGQHAMVFGDVGPLGAFLEPYGEVTEAEALSAFRMQIAALHTAGADGIIVETMVDPAEMAIAVRVAREFGDWPVVATYAFQRGFRTMMGTTVEEALNAAIDGGADVVGANCGTDFSLGDYLHLATELVAYSGDVPVALQPNAGTPQMTDRGLVYSATPAAFAQCAKDALQIGIKLIGGCCGTTPDHIKAMAEVVCVAP